MLDIKWQ